MQGQQQCVEKGGGEERRVGGGGEGLGGPRQEKAPPSTLGCVGKVAVQEGAKTSRSDPVKCIHNSRVALLPLEIRANTPH